MQPLNADISSWRNCYTAALFQDDATMLPTLIARAESEIVARARSLFEARADNAPELRALNNALHMLGVLKRCIGSQKQTPASAELQPSQLPVLASRDQSLGCQPSM